MKVNHPVNTTSSTPVSNVQKNQLKKPEKALNNQAPSMTPAIPMESVEVPPIPLDKMTKDASGKIREARLSSEIGNILSDNEKDDIGQLKDAIHKMAEEFGPEVGEKMFNKLFMDPKSSAAYDKALAEAAEKFKELKKSDPAAAEAFKKEIACTICEKINKIKNGEDDPGC